MQDTISPEERRQIEEYVMKYHFVEKQNKNTPRFLTRLAVKYLRLNQKEYPPELYRQIYSHCTQIEKWHLANKKNVFLIDHLK